MATVHNLEFSIFEIIKFLVVDLVATTNLHHGTNFIKIDQMIAKISHLTIIKMVAFCNLGFLKILTFLNSW